MLNLIVGLIFIIVFALSGQYLKYYFTPEHLNDIPARMMERANHIYILLAALINIMAYQNGRMSSQLIMKSSMDTIFYGIQTLGHILILLPCFLYLAAFFYENNGDLNSRSYVLYGTLCALIGSLAITLSPLLNEFCQKMKTKK